MPVVAPETLVEVPTFHRQSGLEIVQLGNTALADIVARVYDPEAGELGDSLVAVHKDIGDVLDDVHGRVQALTHQTRGAVEGLATGKTGGLFVEAFNAYSLYNAVSQIKAKVPQVEQAALRAGLDERVFDEATGAYSLHSAMSTVREHASSDGRETLRHGLERRLYTEASGAYSIYSAKSTIREYAIHKEALARGVDQRVLDEAMSAYSIYSGISTMREYASNPGVRANMRTAMDKRVEDEAQDAYSLYSAISTIREHASSQEAGQGMRLRLNGRVEREALTTYSAHSGLSTARQYGYGSAKLQIEKKVAEKWLPLEQKDLEERQTKLDGINQKLDEIKAKGRFKRLINWSKTKKLQASAKNQEMLLNSKKHSIAELTAIIETEPETEN
jgi:hypothetical protein